MDLVDVEVGVVEIDFQSLELLYWFQKGIIDNLAVDVRVLLDDEVCEGAAIAASQIISNIVYFAISG